MKKRVIILLGPTGVGKTDISIRLAELLNGEIISSDSMQIYRYMDLGTAKPSLEQRSRITHHMIDIANPWEYFSTGSYIEKVRLVLEDVINRGKIPIIVGGTGLYLRAMTEGIFEGPDADWNLRRKLLAEEKREIGKLYNILKHVDPDAASRISSNDLRRIVRALEVYFLGKISISELQKSGSRALPYDFFKIGITRERKELYKIIESRVDRMIEAGLIQEVRYVLSLIKINSNTDSPLPALQAIGYKEIANYLADLYSMDEAIRLIKKRTKNYAKRQFTWFRKEKDIRWFDISERYNFEDIAFEIFKFLSENLQE